MTTQSDVSLEDKLRAFLTLASDNPEMASFLDRHVITGIPHIDEKCAILSVDGDNERVLKYAVDPVRRVVLSPFLKGIVLRGMKNQVAVQGIPGVQRLESATFYEGVCGLLGPFHYLSGYNLAHPKADFLDDPTHVLHLFREVDSTLDQMHGQKVLHKDVKPGNMVYSHGRLHLIDFSTTVNFTEDLQDLSRGRIFGTPGYIFLGQDRSRDYFALGVSFAKSLIPDLSLQPVDVRNLGAYRLYDFEQSVRGHLTKKYGFSITAYFNDLMHRPVEYDLTHVLKTLESIPMQKGVSNIAYTFQVGNTTYVDSPVVPSLGTLSL